MSFEIEGEPANTENVKETLARVMENNDPVPLEATDENYYGFQVIRYSDNLWTVAEAQVYYDESHKQVMAIPKDTPFGCTDSLGVLAEGASEERLEELAESLGDKLDPIGNVGHPRPKDLVDSD